MPTTLYLFRHGKVDKNIDHDTLSRDGDRFRDWLPSFFQRRGVKLDASYYDAGGDVKRCASTSDRLDCEKKVGYGPEPDRPYRTLNAVLGGISDGLYALCCRGDSIESGQLYHVRNFELHTPFSRGNHGIEAAEPLKDSYHTIYVLELVNDVWMQTEKVRMPEI